jgi:glycosyltransferase involved in cell wall biosynthesis
VQRLAQGLERLGVDAQVEWFAHHYELMPWRLAAHAAPEGTDIVHANSWQGFAFKRDGIPLVITEHQYVRHPAFAPYQGRLQRLYHRGFIASCMKRSFQAADAVVTVSQFCASAMRLDLDKPVEVIHNWVDTALFSPISTELGGSRSRPLRLLFVGNPSRWKGADILSGLAVMLGSDYEILCLGGLRKQHASSAVPSNIRLVPRVSPEGMPDIYHGVDIALVPTRYEAFGYVALEAMACGLPVVGFDSSGTAEVCVHGETALLAPLDDIEQLASYIRQLASDPAMRFRLGAAGRQRAVTCFNEASAVAQYMRIYHNAARIEG